MRGVTFTFVVTAALQSRAGECQLPVRDCLGRSPDSGVTTRPTCVGRTADDCDNGRSTRDLGRFLTSQKKPALALVLIGGAAADSFGGAASLRVRAVRRVRLRGAATGLARPCCLPNGTFCRAATSRRSSATAARHDCDAPTISEHDDGEQCTGEHERPECELAASADPPSGEQHQRNDGEQQETQRCSGD